MRRSPARNRGGRLSPHLLDEVWAAEGPAVPPRPPRPQGAPADLAATILPCTVPGLFEVLRWRTTDEQPPAAVRITSPYDLDARYCSKRDTHWVGYKLHLTETCEPEQPDLITQVLTTPPPPDWTMGLPRPGPGRRDLLPGTHLFDSGYVDADLLVTAQRTTRSMSSGRPLGPIAGNIRSKKAMTCRPLSWIGRPSRRTVPKAMPVSIGDLDAMSRAIRSFAFGLTGPPVAPVPPVRYAPRRKTLHGNSRSGRKRTMRRSRRRANGRKHPRSKLSMRSGLASRAASRKVSGVLISARVATLA